MTRFHVRSAVALLLAHHDEALAVRELAVDHGAVVALDPQAHLEAERAAQPVDRCGGIPVEDGAGEAGPVGGCGLHRVPPVGVRGHIVADNVKYCN
jgi:hypothetical protein